jgi:hypothetical protein
MNLSVIKKVSILTILIILAALYASFLYLDFNKMNTFYSTHKLKYISILLCFILALITMRHSISPVDSFLLQSGLFMTTLADLCLLILNHFTLGVAIFCAAQIIYCIRYYPSKAYSTVVRFLITFEVIAILYILLSIFTKSLDTLFVLAFAYSLCLTTSFILSIKACKRNLLPSPNKYMVVVGMLLFLLCDINVGLTSAIKLMNSQSLLLSHIYNISAFLIWFFYLPSQVLLAMSGYDFCKLRINRGGH